MFIIIETVSFDHPLKSSPYLTWFNQYSFSHFEIADIEDAHVGEIDAAGFVHEIVPEELARGCKFAKADHTNRLGILAGSEIHEELIYASMETHASKPKVYYSLTEEDLALQLAFYKVIMRLELELHYKGLTAEQQTSNHDYKNQILEEINNCETSLQARELMHKKIGIATSHILPAELNWGDPQVLLSE
jgi:hypothetical protein